MSTAGSVVGIVFGCIVAVVFLSLFIYSAYKAYTDRKRIIEKNRRVREEQLLEEGGGEEQARPITEGADDNSVDDPPLLERKWTQKGVAYRREGAVVHISVKDKDKDPNEEELLLQPVTNGCTTHTNIGRPTQNNIEVEINGDPSAVQSGANVISVHTNGQDEANASWL